MANSKKGIGKEFLFSLSWKDKATFELQVVIAKKLIADTYQKALKELVKEVTVDGFRKGKAPLAKAEEKIGKEAVFREVINLVIPRAYQEGLKENNLNPITEPKIMIESAKEEEDWQVKIVASIMPEIDLGNWKEEVRKINATASIWTPEKGGKEPAPQEKEEERQKRFQEILKKILETVKVEVPLMIIETEQQKKLVALIDQVTKTGMTIDQYLNTKGQTIDQLKEQMAEQIAADWKLELVLEKIADEEKIQVEKEELEKIISLEEKEGRKGQINPYLLARLLRRQKTLEHLLAL